MEPCGQVWSRASPAVGWGSSGRKSLLLLGWITETKQNTTNKPKSQSQGLKGKGGTCGQETDRACVWSRGTESERLESRDKKPQSHSENRGRGQLKTQPPGQWRVTDRDLWRNTQTEEWEVGGRGKGGTHWAPGLPLPAWTLWGSLRGPVCATPPQRSGRARAGLRGPGAPWPHTALPECGRVGPSRPVAQRGRGLRQPRCPSPGS